MTKAQLYLLDDQLAGNLPAGPWQAVDRPDMGFYHILDSEGRLVARVDREQELAQAVAQFIATARHDLVALVQEVLRCWERIAGLEGEVEELLVGQARDRWPDDLGACPEVVR